MGQGQRVDLKQCWIEQATRLDKQGYFSRYGPKQRAEVLPKGYIGRFRPDQALYLAREQAKAGTAMRTPQLADNLRTHFGLVGEEARQALIAVLDETPTEAYVPPKELKDPPGTPFVYDSKELRCRLYVKVQVEGSEKKPRVLVWSCHPEWYGRKEE